MNPDRRYIEATISMAFWLTTILGLIILVGMLCRHCKNTSTYKGEIVTDTATLVTIEDSVAQFFTEPGTKFGLTLMGLPGNGKSTMARAIAAVVDSIADLAIINERSGSKSVMVTAKQLVRYYRTHPDQWENLCFKPFLIIDDFGEEPVEVMDYGNVINPVIDLLSRRYDMQKLTILTTNATNLQIRKTYGDRIADRFNEMMKVVIFTNPSYRGQILTE